MLLVLVLLLLMSVLVALGYHVDKNLPIQGSWVDTNITLPASTGIVRTAGDAIVIETMYVVVVQGHGFGEDGESGEKNEGRKELHDDVCAERSVGRT